MTLSQSINDHLGCTLSLIDSHLDTNKLTGQAYSVVYGGVCHPVFEASVRALTADLVILISNKILINNKINDFT